MQRFILIKTKKEEKNNCKVFTQNKTYFHYELSFSYLQGKRIYFPGGKGIKKYNYFTIITINFQSIYHIGKWLFVYCTIYLCGYLYLHFKRVKTHVDIAVLLRNEVFFFFYYNHLYYLYKYVLNMH